MGSSRPRTGGANLGQEIVMGDEIGSSMPTMQHSSGQQQPARWIEGGNFGGKDALALALAAISDVAAQQNGREGDAMSSLFRARAGKRELQQKAQYAGQQREQEYADWVRKEQYKAANPGPVNNDTVADYEFYKQQLGPEAARRYLENQTDPIVNIPLPGGQVYMGPRSKAPGSSQLPTAPVGRLTPLAGGGAGNGASNFPSGNPLQRPW